MTFVELDESEGFILLGRRREKDFLSTRALLEDQVLASCFSKHLRRARGHGDARPHGRGKATQPRQGGPVMTQLRSAHFRVAKWSRARHRKMPSQRAHNRRCSALTNSTTCSVSCSSWLRSQLQTSGFERVSLGICMLDSDPMHSSDSLSAFTPRSLS